MVRSLAARFTWENAALCREAEYLLCKSAHPVQRGAPAPDAAASGCGTGEARRSGTHVAIVAQLVRAPVCGTGGRGFEPHRSPHFLQLTTSQESAAKADEKRAV